MFEKEFANREVAQKIYDLRQQAGLSQTELAKRAGTTQSVISRLEDADYEGHSLTMLNRIAAAVERRVAAVEEDPVRALTPGEARRRIRSKTGL